MDIGINVSSCVILVFWLVGRPWLVIWISAVVSLVVGVVSLPLG